MSGTTRLLVAFGLLALVGTAVLHLLVLGGSQTYWAASTHAMLFGWITAMILAVSYHTMPVFSGRDFPYPRLIQMYCLALCSGVILATWGLARFSGRAIVAGVLLQSIAAALFIANSALLFKRGARRPHRPLAPPIPGQHEVDQIASQATRAAGLALLLALLLLLGVFSDWLGAPWLLAAEHLATLGWIMLMIVGVASHVLPRFSGHGGRGPGWARWQLRGHLLALALMVPALGFGWRVLFAAGAALMAVALALFAWTIWPAIVAARARPQPIQLSFNERPQ